MTMPLPNPVSIPFSKDIFTRKYWLYDEDYNEIKKISGFARFNFKKLPKRYRDTVFYKMEQIKKQMPAQGGQTLRIVKMTKE
jgi:hypothetical protein